MPPTIPPNAADVQPEAVVEAADAAVPTEPGAAAEPAQPPADEAAEIAEATVPGEEAPSAAPQAGEEPAAAAEEPAAADARGAVAPIAEAAEQPAEVVAQPLAARRGVPWRTLAGGLILFVLAIAVGFGAAFLVPGLADVPVPSGAALATSAPPADTASPTPNSTPSPSASASPRPSASPAVSASASPRASSVIYIVQHGDILSTIAARYGVTVQAIVAANGLTDPNHIEPGQRLIIPVP